MSAAKLDLSEFEGLSRCHPTICVVVRSRGQLSPKDRGNFDAALTRKNSDGSYVFADYAISRWLAKRGLGGREQAVAKHRAGDCCCG